MRVEVLHDGALSTAPQLTCAYPLTTCGADGSVVCVYRRGKEKHSYDGVLLSQRSADLGRTFAAPAVLFDGRDRDPPLSAISGGVCACGDGSLLALLMAVAVTRPGDYVFSAAGLTQRHLLVTARSTDGGRSWEPWAEVDQQALGKPLGPTSSPLLLAGGRLFVPVERRHPEGQLGLCAIFSDDHGRSLQPVRDTVIDPSAGLSLCDARYAIFDDGQVLALIWAFRPSDEQTVEVHRSLSTD
ncbi:MAG: sialidase family protein, partial [Gemmatimonadota bacterium]